MRDFFIFGTVDSREYNAYLFENDTFSGHPMTYDAAIIPGRNGDLLTTINRYANVPHVYSCIIATEFDKYYPQLRAALLAQIGYKRLEDSLHPDEFYDACFDSEIVPIKWRDFSMGKFILTFNRKPQRFLRLGESTLSYTSSGSIMNETEFNALPLLRIYGTGSLGINSNTITITEADSYTDIDCDIMEAYKDSAVNPKNDKVILSDNDYPKLIPGVNSITLGTGITRVDITPRWFTL